MIATALRPVGPRRRPRAGPGRGRASGSCSTSRRSVTPPSGGASSTARSTSRGSPTATLEVDARRPRRAAGGVRPRRRARTRRWRTCCGPSTARSSCRWRCCAPGAPSEFLTAQHRALRSGRGPAARAGRVDHRPRSPTDLPPGGPAPRRRPPSSPWPRPSSTTTGPSTRTAGCTSRSVPTPSGSWWPDGMLLVSPSATVAVAAGRRAAAARGRHPPAHPRERHVPAAAGAGHRPRRLRGDPGGPRRARRDPVGGLPPSRLRQLAARVVAVHRMVRGASFAEVHRGAGRHRARRRPAPTTTTMRCVPGRRAHQGRHLPAGPARPARPPGGRAATSTCCCSARCRSTTCRSSPTWWSAASSWRPRLRPRYLDDPDARRRLDRLRTHHRPHPADREEQHEDRLRRQRCRDRTAASTPRPAWRSPPPQMGHEAWLIGVGDFAYEPDGSLSASARGPVDGKKYKSTERFLADVQGDDGVAEQLGARRPRRRAAAQRPGRRRRRSAVGAPPRGWPSAS